MLHRTRQLLVRQRTMLSNAIRGHMAEFGIISAKGRDGTAELIEIIANEQDERIRAAARFSLEVLARHYAAIKTEIGAVEKRIHAWHRSCEESRRPEEIPRIGPTVATALIAEVGDWKALSSGRSLAAWIGLVPGSIRPAARKDSAESQSRATDICDGCLSPALYGCHQVCAAARLEAALARSPYGAPADALEEKGADLIDDAGALTH